MNTDFIFGACQSFLPVQTEPGLCNTMCYRLSRMQYEVEGEAYFQRDGYHRDVRVENISTIVSK